MPAEYDPPRSDGDDALLTALRKERSFLQAVLENAEDGIVACNAQGVLTLFNRATRTFHGLPQKAIAAQEWAEHYDLYRPDGTPMRKEEVPLFRALQGETVRNVEMVIAPKQGQKRTLLASGQALFDEQGVKLGAVVVMHDITERRQGEEERLRRARAEASENLLIELRYVLTHARCLLWHGTVTDWGHGPGVYAWFTQVFDEAAAQEFFALDVDSGESYTVAWYRHRLPEGQALTDRLSTESLCANAPHYSAEFGCRGKDGRVGWFDERVYLEPAPCPEGALGCWRVVGIAIDITERKRAEDALRASAEALQTAHQQTVEILESIGDAFYAVDHAWRFTYVNRRAEGIWGARREDLLGKNLWEVFPHSVGSQIHQELFRAARERQPAEFEMFSSVLGRWLAVKISPTETGLSVYFDDITERKRAEEERRAFLRDVLASVTEGKLRLCDRATDLPARLAPVGEPVSLVAATLRRLRHQALEATRALGFPKDRGEDLISAAGEAGMNAVTHAGGGTGFVGADPRAGVVQVWIEDQGGGIEVGRLPRATLERGWTTIPGNFGHGFWLMLQTVDRVWLLTGTTGTTVVLEQNKKAPELGWMGST